MSYLVMRFPKPMRVLYQPGCKFMFGKFFEGQNLLLVVVVIMSSRLATFPQGRIIFRQVIFLCTFYLKGLIAYSFSLPRSLLQNYWPKPNRSCSCPWVGKRYLTRPQPHHPSAWLRTHSASHTPHLLNQVEGSCFPVLCCSCASACIYSVACWHWKGPPMGIHCIRLLRSLFSNPFDRKLRFCCSCM